MLINKSLHIYLLPLLLLIIICLGFSLHLSLSFYPSPHLCSITRILYLSTINHSSFLPSSISLTPSVFLCLPLRRSIRRVLVHIVSRAVSRPQLQILTRYHPLPPWISRAPQRRATPRLPASTWSGRSQTVTGPRLPPTSSPWTTKPSLWIQGQVTL